METNLHLPLDFESWVEFRALRQAVGAPAAVYALVKLFVDLGYQAQSGRALGLLDEKAITLFEEGLRGPDGLSGLGGLCEKLLDAGLLVGRNGAHFCERFERLN